MTQRVAEIGLLAHETLQRKRSGRIVAVFERSFYALLDERWVCVGSRTIGSGPLHVLCDAWPPAELDVGQGVTVDNGLLCVGGAPLVSFEGAPVWAPADPPRWTAESLRAGLHVADRIWDAMPLDDGLAALGRLNITHENSALHAAALPGVRALARIVADRGGSIAASDRASLVELIGLGPGLTPSGDDLLIGALVALAALGRMEARDAVWSVCRNNLDRTGDISRAHLQAASRGYGAAVLHDAIHAVMRGDGVGVGPAIAAVSSIGHSSGRDGFAGALIALRASLPPN